MPLKALVRSHARHEARSDAELVAAIRRGDEGAFNVLYERYFQRVYNFAYARIENYVDDELVRRLDYRRIEQAQGIWTARVLEMHDLRRDSRTVLTLERLEHNLPMREEDFTLQALRRGR